MLDTVLGLPTHPLIVHATVVVVPTAAVAVLLAAVWPRFRAWAGWGPLALAVLAVVLTPLSTSSGESLEHRVGGSRLIEDHSHLADLLIWWVVPLAVLALALYWLHGSRGGRPQQRGRPLGRARRAPCDGRRRHAGAGRADRPQRRPRGVVRHRLVLGEQQHRPLTAS